jgi:hypothetical protein
MSPRARELVEQLRSEVPVAAPPPEEAKAAGG